MPGADIALANASDNRTAAHESGRALHALMAASFSIGTGEFVIVGLASDFYVSVLAAGLLVSVYALNIAFGSPFVAALLSPVSRRRALLALMLVFVVGDVACALAPGFRFLLVARIATALAHGAFFGIASAVASELAPPGKAARAVALLFTGLTVANILGVPIGTWIGQAAGWRATFAFVAVLAAISLAGMMAWMPRYLGRASGGVRGDVAALREPQIWLAMLVSTLSSAALFTVLTFLTPLLEQEAGTDAVSGHCGAFLFGAGLTAGGLVGGSPGRSQHLARNARTSRCRRDCPSWPVSPRAIRPAGVRCRLHLGSRRVRAGAAVAAPGGCGGEAVLHPGVDAEPVCLQSWRCTRRGCGAALLANSSATCCCHGSVPASCVWPWCPPS